jgi:hypothetical protein
MAEREILIREATPEDLKQVFLSFRQRLSAIFAAIFI